MQAYHDNCRLFNRYIVCFALCPSLDSIFGIVACRHASHPYHQVTASNNCHGTPFSHSVCSSPSDLRVVRSPGIPHRRLPAVGSQCECKEANKHKRIGEHFFPVAHLQCVCTVSYSPDTMSMPLRHIQRHFLFEISMHELFLTLLSISFDEHACNTSNGTFNGSIADTHRIIGYKNSALGTL